jgi:alpha-N-arabinofuranosidase
LNRASQLPLTGAASWAGIWAPTLRHREGVFYLTTTNMTEGGNFIVTARAPEGPWSEPIFVAQKGIDPSLFFDSDGGAILMTSHDGALQSRIDVETGRLLSEPSVVWGGTGGQHPEGPHLYLRNGFYYLLLSEGGTEYGHMITMARSKTPSGPFEPCARNPLLTHRSLKSPIQAVGHADLVETAEGEWFAVFLATRPHGYPSCHHLGRETFLAPVKWSDDGFPIFGYQGRVALEMETALTLEPSSETRARDDFSSKTLDPAWNFLRNPNPRLYSLESRPGFLRLFGSADGLDEVASPAWLGKRQCHFTIRAKTCLEFRPETASEEAGLVVWMNEQHHYEIFLSLREGAPSVVLRRRIGSLRHEVARQELPPADTSRVVIAVDADASRYSFSYGTSDNTLVSLGEGETRYLSTEVAGGFTGVYLALYASGNGAPCKRPADFDWFEYQEA